MKKRIKFELKNLLELNQVTRAEYAFEVSSEGELEQVMTPLLELLNNGKRVELLYCSDSVEHKCTELRKRYSNQLRTFRVPIITFRPFSNNKNAYKWMTAKTLFMCRYDFFPEFIQYGRKKDVRFVLLSGAAKNFQSKSALGKSYLKMCYKSFDHIVAATQTDYDCFIRDLHITKEKLDVFDFRAINIINRIENREETLKDKFPIYHNFQKMVLSSQSTSLILGSFWNHEIDLLEKQRFSTDLTTVIVPHKLDVDELKTLNRSLSDLNISFFELNDKTTDSEFLNYLARYNKSGGIWIFNIKGVLCELYTDFDFAYIGGGFGESIHSVLEPFVSGCDIIHGPHCERSSELDYINSLNATKVSKIETKTQINSLSFIKTASSHDTFYKQFTENYEIILKRLNLDFKED